MKRMYFLLLAALGIGIATHLIPSTAYACSCVPPQTVEDEFNRSETVFAGRVLNVEDQRQANGIMTKSVLLEVSRVWKGGPQSQIIIHTGSGGGDCGFDFQEGKEYLVYARVSSMYGDKELLTTIICDRTTALVQAKDDLAALGEGKVPTERVNLEGEPNQVHPYVWVGIGVAVIGVLFYIWRKWGKKNQGYI